MNWLKSILSFLYPKVCPACYRRICQDEAYLCLKCELKMPKTSHHLSKNNDFTDKLIGRLEVQSAAARFYFSDSTELRQLLHALKYRNRYDIGFHIGLEYGKMLIETSWFDSVDAIVPVPLHPSKLRKRGYNQSESFARGLAHAMNANCDVSSLTRCKPTQTQTKKSRLDRVLNMKNAFSCTKDIAQYHHVLLVDDVVTTGSTLEACGQSMKAAGLTHLSVCCIAMAVD